MVLALSVNQPKRELGDIMTNTIIITTTEKDKFYESFRLLAKAVDELKAALDTAEPLAISAAAYRIVNPYDAMDEQATLMFDEMDAAEHR